MVHVFAASRHHCVQGHRSGARYRLTFIILLAVTGLGCSTVHFGTYPDGFSSFPERPISPEEAVAAAQPYLDQTFALSRTERGSDWPSWEPAVRVKLEGKYYYVLKDNYPAKNSNYGFAHATKVNAETGDVIPPEQPRRKRLLFVVGPAVRSCSAPLPGRKNLLPTGGSRSANNSHARIAEAYPVFVQRWSQAAPTGRDSIAQGERSEALGT
jgi:hypothetical protein